MSDNEPPHLAEELAGAGGAGATTGTLGGSGLSPRNRSRDHNDGGLGLGGGAAFPDEDRAMFTEAVASEGSEEVTRFLNVLSCRYRTVTWIWQESNDHLLLAFLRQMCRAPSNKS